VLEKYVVHDENFLGRYVIVRVHLDEHLEDVD
jgi:hypothetical protein